MNCEINSLKNSIMFHLIVEANDVRLMDFKCPFISSNDLKHQTNLFKYGVYILKFQKVRINNVEYFQSCNTNGLAQLPRPRCAIVDNGSSLFEQPVLSFALKSKPHA